MDEQLRTRLLIARGNHYYCTVSAILICFALLGGIIAFGGGEKAPWAVGAAIVGTAVFGIVAGDSALKDIMNLRESMTVETAGTGYGKGIKSTPYPAFRAISAVVTFAIAVAQLASL